MNVWLAVLLSGYFVVRLFACRTDRLLGCSLVGRSVWRQFVCGSARSPVGDTNTLSDTQLNNSARHAGMPVMNTPEIIIRQLEALIPYVLIVVIDNMCYITRLTRSFDMGNLTIARCWLRHIANDSESVTSCALNVELKFNVSDILFELT